MARGQGTPEARRRLITPMLDKILPLVVHDCEGVKHECLGYGGEGAKRSQWMNESWIFRHPVRGIQESRRWSESRITGIVKQGQGRSSEEHRESNSISIKTVVNITPSV